jgi:hypothetical protein
MAGLLGDSGAAACPRPMGGSPPVAGAAAGRLPRIRRQAVPGRNEPAAPRLHGWQSRPPVAGQSLTVKAHHQGRAWRRVAEAMAQAPPLTVIFRGKTSAPIRRTGTTGSLAAGQVAGRRCRLGL